MTNHMLNSATFKAIYDIF